MAVVSREELAIICRLDEDALIDHAMELAEENEEILKGYGIIYSSANAAKFRRVIREMTLNNLDYPGTKCPDGTQKLINEMKPKHF